MADTTNQNIQNLFAEALRETSDLAQKEFALLRTEVTQNIRTMAMGIGMMVAAAVFAIVALILLMDALVKWLATIVHSEALSALIVGGVLAIIAIGLGLYGRSMISSFSLTPKRTVRSIRRDTQVLSERVAG
jgi:nucleoside permease NupC